MTEKILRQRPRHPVAIVTGLLLVVMFIFAVASLTGEATEGQRMVILRYYHFILSGFFAFATPHLLFPDKKLALLRMMNPGRLTLHRLQFRQLGFWLGLVLAGQMIIVFHDLNDPFGIDTGKLQMAFTALLFTASVSLLSVLLYVRLGMKSQLWQEGKRGKRFMDILSDQGKGVAAPAGTVPTIIVTITITAGGMLSVVLAAWAGSVVNVYVEWLSGAILLIPGGWLMAVSLPVYDRYFYQTNAFYFEIFKDPGSRGREEWEPVPYRALYWIPEVFRPAAWLSLLQFDRKLPMGRVMAVCHLILWILIYTGSPELTLQLWLGAFIILQNAASYLLITPAFAPLSFQNNHFSVGKWVGARAFVNLRWFFPLLLNLSFLALVSRAINFDDILLWCTVHIIFAFTFSVLYTGLHELRYRRIYA